MQTNFKSLLGKLISGTSKVILGALLVVCGVSSLFAQGVGFGTLSPNASAELDLTSTTQGLLVPRMSNYTTAITSPANGLLVYDNSLNTFYYYNGAAWVPFLSSSGSAAGWLLTGNAGTTAGTNFVGTTDATDMVFKTNSTERMRLTSAGLLGVGVTGPGQKLEVAGNMKADEVASAASSIQFQNPAATFSTTIQAGAQAAAIAYTLPTSQGIAGTLLTNNGSGNLSWGANTVPAAWLLPGNTGTTPGTNFLGTTDSKDLVFKTNAVEGMRLSSSGNLGIGTNAPTSILHTVASGAQVATYTGNLLTNTATSSTASITNYGAQITSTGTWNGATATNVGLSVNATGGTTNYSATFQGGNVGVNTTTPATYLDINGDYATRYAAYAASNGANNNIAIGTASFVRISGPTAGYSITGIAGGVDGKMLTLFNSTSDSITISNESASSTAANRIWTLNSTGDIILTGKASADLIYSAADSRWIVISTSTNQSTSSSGIYTKKKPADQTVATTTLTNDNMLYIPIAANDSMQIQGYLDAIRLDASDETVAITIPSGATMNVLITASHANSGYNEYFLTTSGVGGDDIDSNPNAADENGILFFGTVTTGATAGNIQVQWSQWNSSANVVTVKAGSYMEGDYIRQ